MILQDIRDFLRILWRYGRWREYAFIVIITAINLFLLWLIYKEFELLLSLRYAPFV